MLDLLDVSATAFTGSFTDLGNNLSLGLAAASSKTIRKNKIY